MATLVERARGVISAEDDDFFVDETIVDYLNKSQEIVISYLTRLETEMRNKTLRALDGLRKIHNHTLIQQEQNSNYVASIDFPNDLKQYKYLEYNEQTPLKELDPSNLSLLHRGNAIPSVLESYYTVINENNDTKKFKIYLYENGIGKNIDIHYIKNPSEIIPSTEGLEELPFKLENAVVYGAAVMMLGQESIKDPESNIQAIQRIYSEQLENNIY